MIKIAIATNDGSRVARGHFAHAKKFLVFSYDKDEDRVELLDERDNKLGELPDYDDPHSAMKEMEELDIPLHGVPKYSWLKENVLNDVDVILCGGACQTSYNYFMAEGVVVLFDTPDSEIEESVRKLLEALK